MAAVGVAGAPVAGGVVACSSPLPGSVLMFALRLLPLSITGTNGSGDVVSRVSLKRKPRVYELVADQRLRRGLGEENVPRHEPRHRCDHPRATPAERRLGAKMLAVTEDELRARLLTRCCNSGCGAKVSGQLDGIMARRRHYHLIPQLLQRRAYLTTIISKGYYVSLFCASSFLAPSSPCTSSFMLPLTFVLL